MCHLKVMNLLITYTSLTITTKQSLTFPISLLCFLSSSILVILSSSFSFSLYLVSSLVLLCPYIHYLRVSLTKQDMQEAMGNKRCATTSITMINVIIRCIFQFNFSDVHGTRNEHMSQYLPFPIFLALPTASIPPHCPLLVEVFTI